MNNPNRFIASIPFQHQKHQPSKDVNQPSLTLTQLSSEISSPVHHGERLKKKKKILGQG